MAVAVLDACEAATLVWSMGGQTFLTLVVTASFGLSDPGPARRVAPRPLSFAESVRSDGRSLRYAVDVVPYRPRADVTLVGHVYAPASGATRAAGRLTLERGPELLINKTVAVHAPHTFAAWPLRWEEALGGPEGDNPVGTGAPTVVLPGAPRAPAGFGPLAAPWPSRARLKHGAPRRRAGAFVYPDGFDWAHCQAAPPDQQVRHLMGDESIRLDGLHPDHAQLVVQLPQVRAVGVVFGLGPPDRQLCPFVADTLILEPDERRVSVVWRAIVEATDVAAARAADVAVGVAERDRPVLLPERRDDAVRLAGDAPPQDFEGTIAMSSVAPSPHADAPFALASVAPAGATAAESLDALRAETPPPPPLAGLQGTLDLGADEADAEPSSSARDTVTSAVEAMAAAMAAARVRRGSGSEGPG
ncbi:MAG: DUF2169 domain-containing protein [Myxococcota bacterium]